MANLRLGNDVVVPQRVDMVDIRALKAVAEELVTGKELIAQAINEKGVPASAEESLAELAQDVENIPNFDDMAKLAGIIAGGNYIKDQLQGHNENVKYGKTEIVDLIGAFETINIPSCFRYWDLLERVDMPNLTLINAGDVFRYCSALITINMPNLRTISSANMLEGAKIEVLYFPALESLSGSAALNPYNTRLKQFIAPNLSYIQYSIFRENTNLENVVVGTLTNGGLFYGGYCPSLRNVTIGQDTNINLPFQLWTATNVIAEGQSGIDELNSNLQTNLISKLYQGGGKILGLGAALYDVTTQETRDMVTSKGWTLQRG
jgi:hypothetical protein